MENSLKRAGTARATSSIIKSGQKDTEASIHSLYMTQLVISMILVKSVQSALSDLLTTSATHGTFSRPSTKRGLILIGLELNTNARESFEHC